MNAIELVYKKGKVLWEDGAHHVEVWRARTVQPVCSSCQITFKSGVQAYLSDTPILRVLKQGRFKKLSQIPTKHLVVRNAGLICRGCREEGVGGVLVHKVIVEEVKK